MMEKLKLEKKDVRGKKVELYACSNAFWTTEDGEFFEFNIDFKMWI